jgi:peptide/nickel transport system permease protein
MNSLIFMTRRIVGILLVLAGVSVITFAISHLIPSDPVAAALGDRASEGQILQFRAEYGLDKPLAEQYLLYVSHLVHGDLGISIRTRNPVADDLRAFFPATFELSVAALLISLFMGIPMGIWSALFQDRLPDSIVRVFSLIGGSMPTFWLGLVLIGVAYGRLGLLPSGGRIDDFIQPPPAITGLYVVDSLLSGNMVALKSSLQHLVLPAFTLGYFATAVIARMMRSSMLEVLPQDFIRTARAKGLSERLVILRHALPNAMIPSLTIIGIALGSLLSGAVLTETVFSWPGLGRYATASAMSLDFPAVMGVTLLAAVIYSVANLVVDLGYGWLDPRM